MTFIIGTIIGFALGFTVAAILMAGRAADRDMEWVAYVQEGWQPEQAATINREVNYGNTSDKEAL